MESVTKARVLFYGLSPEAELWADEVEGLGLDGIRFRLHYADETLHVRIPMVGRHSVETALRAAAVGLIEGLSWQEIFAGLRQGNTQLRLVAVRSRTGALLLDDTYNASPESMLAALNLLARLAASEKSLCSATCWSSGPTKSRHTRWWGHAPRRLRTCSSRSDPGPTCTREAARRAGMKPAAHRRV